MEYLNMLFNKFFLALIIYCICYVLVLFAIAGDLASGIRKARKAGIARMSTGYKQTLNKIAKYYNSLFSASIVDAFLMMVLYAFQQKGIFVNFPLIPVFAVIIGIYIAFIEFRSVHEKLEDKEKARMSTDFKKLCEILQDENKAAKVFDALKYIDSKERKEDET